MKNGSLILAVVCIFFPTIASCGASSPSLSSGSYIVTQDAVGADTLDDLAQIDDCIRRKDKECQRAMLMDGRIVLVKAGTSMDATGVGYDALICDVRSGALIGKRIYLPVAAVK